MGLLIRLFFFALAFAWLYRQIIRPLAEGMAGGPTRSNFQQKKRAAQPPPAAKAEPKIEYRKFSDDDGEYVDYEEVK